MSDELRQQVTHYNELVKQYHALDDRIDALLMAHQGHTENMSEAAMQQYRQLAQERDEVLNSMRALEQVLFADDSS